MSPEKSKLKADPWKIENDQDLNNKNTQNHLYNQNLFIIDRFDIIHFYFILNGFWNSRLLDYSRRKIYSHSFNCL